jgi:hypothetical protein
MSARREQAIPDLRPDIGRDGHGCIAGKSLNIFPPTQGEEILIYDCTEEGVLLK